MTARPTTKLIGFALLPLLTAALPAKEPILTIKLFNYADAPSATLAAAAEVSRRIFSRAGLVTVWAECGTRPGHSGAPPCGERPRKSALHVNVLSRSKAEKLGAVMGAFGVAFPGEEGFGVVASVFHHQVVELEREYGLDRALILGHVLAHEIGHLLLGLKSHANSGIMTAGWYRAEMVLVQQGRLNFLASEARRLREQVKARELEDGRLSKILRGALNSHLEAEAPSQTR